MTATQPDVTGIIEENRRQRTVAQPGAMEFGIMSVSDVTRDPVSGNTPPDYEWFGKDIRQGLPLALEGYDLLHRLWHQDVVDWQGGFRPPLRGFTSIPRPIG